MKLDSNSSEDFDALHGTSLTDPDKPLILYWNRKNAMEKHKRDNKTTRLLLPFIVVPIVLAIAMVYFALSIVFTQWIAVAFCLPLVLMALSMPARNMLVNKRAKYDFWNSTNPVMQIRPEGLSINCPARNFNTIPWNCIKEVKPYSYDFKDEFLSSWYMPTWKMLRIVPNNIEEVMKFATEDTSRLEGSTLLSAEEARKIHLKLRKSRFWKFLLPKNTEHENSIDIPEDWLPLNAHEIAEYINIRIEKFSSTTDGLLE